MAVRRFAENIIVKSEFETNETESRARTTLHVFTQLQNKTTMLTRYHMTSYRERVYLLQEVKDDGVDDAVRQRVLLVEQRAQEDAVGAVVVHLGNFQDGRRRVEHGYRVLGHDAADDGCLAQCARAALKRSRATPST